jgi:decaprenylphospho-beta-D-ribofuranose 2-oxidase
MGGALASDIQGKNHHVDGALSAHTESVDMVLASGEHVRVGPDADPELFWATAGGMGLTGLITSAKIRMRPIETSQLLVDTTRAADLDELITAMYAADATHRYSVAWVDTLATGRSLGRSVLTVGDFAGVADLPVKQRTDPLGYSPASPLGAPKIVPNLALNRWSVAAFNEMWFRKAPKHRLGEVQSIGTFFHPLDGVADWNYVYGPRGFLQYQVIVPDGHEDLLRTLLERFAVAKCPVFLAVLKRFGDEGPSPITFALRGWTLALDIPTDVPGLNRLLDEMDADVAAVGGRIYLTKDSRMSQQSFQAMYPRAKEFERVRDRVDPDRKFRSDLSERLGL